MTTNTNDSQSYSNDTDSQFDADCSVEWLKSRRDELTALIDEKSHDMSVKAKERVTTSMSRIEHAIRKASANLSKHEEPQAASIAESVADQIHETAKFVAEIEPKEMVQAGSAKVKKSPAVALAAAAVAGVLLGRILKQTSDEYETSYSKSTS